MIGYPTFLLFFPLSRAKIFLSRIFSMFLEEIIVANSTAVVLCLILLISRWLTRRVARVENKIFTWIIYIGIAAAIFETFSFVVDGKAEPALRVFNILANSLLYFCTATVSILWLWYADLHLNPGVKRSKALYFPMFIVWAILVTSLVFNAFFGFLFTVDENNVYARQPAGYAFYVLLFASFIITIVMYIRTRVVHGKSQFFPIWMFLSPIIITCIIQALWYGISLAWLGCGVGLVGIYLNFQSKQSLVDNLTNLYNRNYIEHKLVVARFSDRYVYSGIMLDIDRFKEINDTYGHSVGDEALRKASLMLLNCTDRDSMAFRFAGDEFIILVRVPASRATDLEAKTIEVEERVRKETEIFNSDPNNTYKIVFSMGHATYNTHYDDDLFFHNMDNAMYKEKQIHHQENK